MLQLKNKKYIVLLSAIFFLAVTFFVSWHYISNIEKAPAIKSGSVMGVATRGMPSELKLASKEKTKTILSPVYRADFEFNALAPHWKESVPNGSERKFYLRASTDSSQWSEWILVQTEGPVKDGEKDDGSTFADSPLFIKGRHFQYKLELRRNGLDVTTPRITSLNLGYIDSRKPQMHRLLGMLPSFTQKAAAKAWGVDIVSRAEWGNPDPYGHMLKGTDAYWHPSYAPVKQIFIHHTVNKNYNSDPAEVVRAIWHYHTYTRGWGDIGYNYLLDQNGTVYEGRAGGDNIVAGHVYEYNKGSLGVALIGCYDSANETCQQLNGGSVSGPTANTWSSLTSLLSWKTTNFEIDPLGTQSFCKYDGTGCLSLPTVAGHRDANPTTCPGNLAYDNLGNVRSETDWKNNNVPWAYSAQQLTYGTTDLSGVDDTETITLQFKNTGTATWSNSTNRLLLRTAAPMNRHSEFQSLGWIDEVTPAVLSEPSVPPGQVGTFTFDIKRGSSVHGFYNEYFRVVAEGVNELKSHFAVPISAYCNIGTSTNMRSNGMIINDTSTGKVYKLVNGTKRWIRSGAAVETNGYSFSDVVHVSGDEANLYPNASDMKIREGSLVTSPNAGKLYMIDETDSGYVKRWVYASAMTKLGLKWKVSSVSDAELSSYPGGTDITPSSPLPDGLLVNESSTGKVFLTQNSERRWVQSPLSLLSHGHAFDDVLTAIPESTLDTLPESPVLKVRPGTLLTSSSTTKVYTVDNADGAWARRWVKGHAFEETGFKWHKIHTASSAELNSYTDSDAVECHL